MVISRRNRYSEMLRVIVLAALMTMIAQRADALAGGFIADISTAQHEAGTDIALQFRCIARYVTHAPVSHGHELRIQLDSIESCAGAGSLAILARDTKQIRLPHDNSTADIDYIGDSAGGPQVVLRFKTEVQFALQPQRDSRELIISVSRSNRSIAATPSVDAKTADFAINLESVVGFRPATGIALPAGLRQHIVYGQTVTVNGQEWNRLRLGFFATETEAAQALNALRPRYPKAWVTRVGLVEIAEAGNHDPASGSNGDRAAFAAVDAPDASTTSTTAPVVSGTKAMTVSVPAEQARQELEEARQSMIGGDPSRAIQLYTRILRNTDHPAARDALEYLGLARERSGQSAHAKAEYQRYLDRYPDGDGTKRVKQRLAALVANTSNAPRRPAASSADDSDAQNWQADTYWSQYYRYQANEVDGRDAIVNLSSLVSDADFRLRRRSEHFDISTRLTASYWFDFLNEDEAGNQNRISQAYVELNDNRRELRARIGRQSRSTSGVLGRFDGVFAEYGLRDDIRLSFTTGFPVYSTKSGFDDKRLFYGMSVELEDILGKLDVTPYYNRQYTDGIDDRQSIGIETRYSDESRTLVGVWDYDISYEALNSIYLLGNWRTEGKLTFSAMMDRRRSPFLSVNNALVGQPLSSLQEMLLLFSEPEIRQLALDRTAVSTSYRFGVSRPLTQRWRVDADIVQTQFSGTIASAGVVETPPSNGYYYSATLMGQSLLKQGDALILGMRAADTPGYQSTTATLDARFPFGALRVNPRIRIDRRERVTDGGVDWIYSPRLRLQFRWRRNNQFELMAGGIFSNRELNNATAKTRTYFFNTGYRYVF